MRNHPVNRLLVWAERRQLIPRPPLFWRDYQDRFPALKQLEVNHSEIRTECEALMEIREHLADVEQLGGEATKGGIHSIAWKSFMFKAGQFIPENCSRCPRTAAILAEVPNLYLAFFSILEPNQYITPHFGPYKGILRYHLGVIIPGNNSAGNCWMRVNDDPEDNAREDISRVDRGVKYYWHEGEGVLFDDTFMHDAANESNAVRVVLWIDIARPMPFYWNWFNKTILWVGFRNSFFKQMRENARVSPVMDKPQVNV